MQKIFFITLTVAFNIFGCKNTSKDKGSRIEANNSDYPSVSITPNSEINSPLAISVNANGKWKANEGEIGYVVLYNASNEKLAQGILSSKDGDWMTNKNTNYITNLSFRNQKSQQGKLVFYNNFVTEEGGNKKDSFSIPVKLRITKNAEAMVDADGNKTFCFASKTPSPIEKGAFNYHFIQVKVDKNNKAKAYEISAPYGSDGSRTHISGSFNPSTGKLDVKENTYAEGEISSFAKSYLIKDNKIGLGFLDENKKEVSLEQVDCVLFQQYMKDFENDFNFAASTKTSPRIDAVIKKAEYTPEDVKKLQFLEREIELNNNINNKEYLVYIYGPMACGTGGCNLYVVDDKNKIVSTTSVVKMPIYMPNEIFSKPKKNPWAELIVWSDGAYRKLSYGKKGYDSNGSLAPKIQEQDIEFHPELYRKVMDYED